MKREFLSTRAAGLARLAAFTPLMGRAYGERRNTDPGPDQGRTVSALSPYTRRRLVLESELVQAALQAHGPDEAGKFIQETVWRSYWKGWLEHHPSVWHTYRRDAAALHDRLDAEPALRRDYQAAVEGRTGIACFDAWAEELAANNWLHNHARMWFASIWIFSLRLPWQLGAEFFLWHLLDGDPASNTLSWRWVAGLQTHGKHYVATAENIARFTRGRFNPAGQLNENPVSLVENDQPAAMITPHFEQLPEGNVVLLVHEDDCAPETLLLGRTKPKIIVSLVSGDAKSAAAVSDFAAAACDDAAWRASAFFHCNVPQSVNAHDLGEWARQAGLPVVTAYPPVGQVADALAATEVRLHRIARRWDQAIWPSTTRGFFYLRKRLPAILPEALKA